MNIVRELIIVGVNVNFRDILYILLIVVCWEGYMFIVEELVKVDVDVNLRDVFNILIVIFCEYGYVCIVEVLRKVGVEFIFENKSFNLMMCVC